MSVPTTYVMRRPDGPTSGEAWVYSAVRNQAVAGSGRWAAIAQRLPLRHDLRNHSPDGFEWGYAGSGPAQLALALCAHALGDDARALEFYQFVKWELIATEERGCWSITRQEVVALVGRLEQERAAGEARVERGDPPGCGPEFRAAITGRDSMEGAQ